MAEIKKISFYTAVAIVIANMIGTGVFTSLGFQLAVINNPISILILWTIGGMLALFGAFTYGEIGSIFPRSGGEYNYLREIYHPLLGFLAGWVSSVVGFSAPVALAAMALGKYLYGVNTFFEPKFVSVLIVLFVTTFHLFNLKVGSDFQKVVTFIKVALILAFIICGIFISNSQSNSFQFNFGNIWNDLKNPAFAVSLVYVSFAYSGWNASSYLAEEIDNPKKNLHKSLFWGTLIVTILYLALNFVFLWTAPMQSLKGEMEIGIISAKYIFGDFGSKVMGTFISLLLISSISSMVFAGPRVSKAIGEDYKILSILSKTNKFNIPIVAISIQTLITLFMLITSTFESVMVYTGFTLNLFTLLTVIGIFVIRYKNKSTGDIYRTFGYPVVPIIFVIVNIWFLYFVIIDKPKESLIGLLTLIVGTAVYFLTNKFSKNEN